MKQRIRHLFPHNGGIINDERVPRGWITPQGRFIKTKEHWVSINCHFRRPETRSLHKEEAPEEAEAAERTAHLAYNQGWISVGHAGKLNAIGHERTFQALNHPAVDTLRKLLAELPDVVIQIELQIGSFLPREGIHENFELREYDLDILIKRGRLREPRGE
jgi:hypothetical protein